MYASLYVQDGSWGGTAAAVPIAFLYVE